MDPGAADTPVRRQYRVRRVRPPDAQSIAVIHPALQPVSVHDAYALPVTDSDVLEVCDPDGDTASVKHAAAGSDAVADIVRYRAGGARHGQPVGEPHRPGGGAHRGGWVNRVMAASGVTPC